MPRIGTRISFIFLCVRIECLLSMLLHVVVVVHYYLRHLHEHVMYYNQVYVVHYL